MNAQIVHAQSGGRALIIGAGIGGLAVAVALGRAGFTVHVFESASSLEPTVIATPLLPSAVRALRALGMAPTVPTLRVAVADGVLRSARGHTLVTIATSDLAYRFGAVSAAVHRADFQHLLLSSLPAGTVRPNARCVGVEQDAGGVAAHFADGSIARGDVLIGADGPHAIVRAHLFGAPPRYTGYAVWRGVARLPRPRVQAGESWGTGGRFGLFPLSDARVSWYAVASVSGEELGALRSPGADLLDRFGGWHDPIPAVIAATEGGAIVRHASHDQEPLARWSAGRIALVGDAAHPMTTNLGLGACQAIENAAILGHCLRTGGEVPDALRRYEAWRLPWSHMVSQRARRLSPVA